MKSFVAVIIVTLMVLSAEAQTRHTISGTVTDENGELLIGVNVYNSVKDAGTITNEYGFYSLTLPDGPHEIVFSSIGYDVYKKELLLSADLRLNAKLVTEITQLDEVASDASKPHQDRTDAAMVV